MERHDLGEREKHRDQKDVEWIIMVFASIKDSFDCHSYTPTMDGRLIFYFREKGGKGDESDTISLSAKHIAQMASLIDFKAVFKIDMPENQKKKVAQSQQTPQIAHSVHDLPNSNAFKPSNIERYNDNPDDARNYRDYDD